MEKNNTAGKTRRGQTAIEYVMMINSGRPGGHLRRDSGFRISPAGLMGPASPSRTCTVPLARPAPRPLSKRRGQTAIEYVMMISATVVFISLTAFFIKTRVIAP